MKKKSYKYTILAVFMAFVFAFGSMTGMNIILHAREKQLLTEKGKAVVEVPVRSWQASKNSVKGVSSEGSMLTAKQMEEVISQWDENTTISHSPVDGQISMEEAISAGKDWLIQMGMTGSGQKTDLETYSASARLVTSIQKESMEKPLEPYYSSWYVRLSGSSVTAFLYINAVTGKVWSADVTIYDDLMEKISYEKLPGFVESAGLAASGDIICDRDGTKALLKIDDSRLWARMEIYRSDMQYSYAIYNENGLTDYYEEALNKKRITVVFQFTLSG